MCHSSALSTSFWSVNRCLRTRRLYVREIGENPFMFRKF